MKRCFLMLAGMLLLISLTACKAESAEEDEVIIYGFDGSEQDEYVIENENLAMNFFPETTSFTLTDKSSGNVWYSNPQGASEDGKADVVTKRLMQSQFSLKYSNGSGVTGDLDSFYYSVSKGLYEFEILENAIEVNYTVGDIDRVYYIPYAVPESRMLEFHSQMEKSEQRKIDEFYRKYDINKLRATDDKSALLASYPDLENEPIYVLRDTIQPFVKSQIETMFEKYGYTAEDYEADMARYQTVNENTKPTYNVTLRYELDGDSFKVSVPYEKIDYNPDYPIVEFNLLPYFGSGGLEDEGYLFVPDASGALINFNNGRTSQNPYVNSVYGFDEGLYREAVVSDNKAYMPVFGIHNNNNTILCIIEEGASYANVKADISGRNSSFNTVYANYAMVHKETMDISAKSDKTVLLFERGLPNEQIVQKYVLCGNGGYVGMAKKYRDYLTERNPELTKITEADVPVAIELIGAVNSTQFVAGIPFDLPLKLSTYKDMTQMVNGIADAGIKNIDYRLIGWFNKSVQHTVPTSVNLISKLGSSKDFKNVISAINNSGNEVYLDADFLYMRDDKLFDGFSTNSDAARYVNRERIESYPYSFIWYGERDSWGKLSYLARPAYMMELIDDFSKTINKKFGVNNIAFRSEGSRLAGDYNEKRLVSREASMNMQIEKFKQLNSSGTKAMINSGYIYAAAYADFIVDAPLSYQGFGILDAEVPFYEIVLHGLVSYSGRAVNLSEDYSGNILNLAETGAGLFFSFMKEETSVLQLAKYHQYYGNEYDKWINDAKTIYEQFTQDFSGIYNQFIVNHTILEKDVTITEYENGTKVLVNKLEIDYNYNGETIPARSYKVMKGGM